ncbi:MAG: hypothetical protein KA196_04380 [Arenimonas sp.]|nr:hypothetical protein [Arenimonas sp.]
MVALLRQLFEVCLLRRGPQDLPHAPPVVAALVVALLAVQLAFASHQGLPAPALSARVMVTLVILLGVTGGLLAWRKLENRGSQTLLALAGTGLIFTLAMMPMALALQPHLGDTEPPPQVMVYALAALGLFVWKLRVEAAIWRQALDIPASPAYALTLALVLAEAVLLFLFSPAPLAAAP